RRRPPLLIEQERSRARRRPGRVRRKGEPPPRSADVLEQHRGSDTETGTNWTESRLSEHASWTDSDRLVPVCPTRVAPGCNSLPPTGRARHVGGPWGHPAAFPEPPLHFPTPPASPAGALGVPTGGEVAR